MLIVSLSTKAYHVSNDKYNIATVNHGVGATIKIWASRRSSRAQGQVSGSTNDHPNPNVER